MGTLVCVHGPSQAGKNTLIDLFLQEFPSSTRLVTASSRPAREGEINGKDKFFIARSVFEEHKDDFFEMVEEHGNYYGIMKEPLYFALEQHAIVLADIDMRGIRSLMQEDVGHPVKAIFVCPDTFEELEQRIRKRGDANADVRVETARQEWHNRQDPVFSAVISTSCPVAESYAAFKKAVLDLVDKI